MRRRQWTEILLPVGDEPPTEFRVFAKGTNESVKGPALFDEAGASAVMAAYEQHGVDIAIDLEHLSLDTYSPNYDPDARGWCKLAIRNGELWAVDVKWTEDGAERLRSKRQRYVSPAFYVDDEERVVELLNIAICAMPATHEAPPLVAATTRYRNTMPEDEEMAAARAQLLRQLMGLEEGASDEEMSKALAEMGPDEMMSALTRACEMIESSAATRAEGGDNEDAEIASAARSITKRSAGREVVAHLRALSDSASTTKRLTAEVADLRQRQLTSDLREIVRDNPKRIASPKQEAYVLSLRSVEEARAYVETLPEVVVDPVRQQSKPSESPDEIKLTESDRAVIKLTGTDPDKFLAAKKRDAERRLRSN